MDCKFDITNRGYSAEEEFIVTQFSGDTKDLPERVQEVLSVKEAHKLNGGDWITIADGEIISTGEFHPFLIQVSDEEKSYSEQIRQLAEDMVENGRHIDDVVQDLKDQREEVYSDR